MKTIKIAVFGDLVGVTGRDLLKRHLPSLKKQYAFDVVIVNGENCAHGKGITPAIAQDLHALGVAVITSGNHIWDKKEIIPYIATTDRLLRPLNYPSGCPGVGAVIIEHDGIKIGIINTLGRVFMNVHPDCPFQTTHKMVSEMRSRADIIIVDFHAETTSEKLGLAYYLDGTISALVGTHTHVQTADERILPGGTAYITDIGMTGSLNSMLGVTNEPLLHKFLTQMPVQHIVAKNQPYIISGAVISIDRETKQTVSIERIYKVDTESLQ